MKTVQVKKVNYLRGKSAGDGHCWSEEKGWKKSTNPKHPPGTIWREGGLEQPIWIMYATDDPNTYKDKDGNELSCPTPKDGHPTLDPDRDALNLFPKFVVPFLQDGVNKGLMFKTADEVPAWKGHLVLTYRQIAIAWVKNLKSVVKTEKQKKWLNRLVKELKSQHKITCVPTPMHTCKDYLVHYWLIANAAAYLCGYWGECNPPLIGTTKSIAEQWVEIIEKSEIGSKLKTVVIVGGVVLAGLVVINIAKATSRGKSKRIK